MSVQIKRTPEEIAEAIEIMDEAIQLATGRGLMNLEHASIARGILGWIVGDDFSPPFQGMLTAVKHLKATRRKATLN